jgi:anti-sigma factor RsiW
MNVTCEELQSLLHGYVDGELDLVRHLDIERHLADCPRCADACKQLQLLQAALKGKSFHFTPPPALRRRIDTALRNLDDARPSRRRPWGLLALAAAALLVLGAWAVLRAGLAAENDRGVRELVASHVRSLMLDEHLYDVKSSDKHTVKPWFLGKVDFSPVVGDFATDGFPLAGGRLDYIEDRPVAALVYHRRKHVINLFVWPAPRSAEAEPRALTRQGYQMLHWSRGGMSYWAVSDLNAAELRTFADLVIQQAP